MPCLLFDRDVIVVVAGCWCNPNPNLEIEFVVCGEVKANATSTAAAAENNIYIMSANEDGVGGILRHVIVYLLEHDASVKIT